MSIYSLLFYCYKFKCFVITTGNNTVIGVRCIETMTSQNKGIYLSVNADDCKDSGISDNGSHGSDENVRRYFKYYLLIVMPLYQSMAHK